MQTDSHRRTDRKSDRAGNQKGRQTEKGGYGRQTKRLRQAYERTDRHTLQTEQVETTDTHRQAGRQADGQTDRQTDRPTDH